MAFEYLNETTYTKQLAEQENILNQLQEQAAYQAQDIDYDMGDTDLIEILTQEADDNPDDMTELDDSEADKVAETTMDFENEELDDTDIELMDFLFREQSGTQEGAGTLRSANNTIDFKGQGLNPHIKEVFGNLQSKYQVGSLGTWGDKDHQTRKSDHNTGDAIDLSFGNDQNKRQQIVDDLVADPKTKYVISNGQIWNPEKGNKWRPYSGKDPHTGHIHVSMKRQFGGSTLVADDEKTLRRGLNDNGFDQALLKLNGTNTIRGLDNYQPVAVTDGSKYKVLTGPKDTAKFKGNVYEKRIK